MSCVTYVVHDNMSIWINYYTISTFSCKSWPLVLSINCWINNEVWVGVGEIDPEGSGSLPEMAKTVLATKYLYNDAKCLFLSERWVFFLQLSAIFVVLIMWHNQTNQHHENGTIALPAGCSPCKNLLLGVLPCQQGVVPWDYALVLAGHPPS